MHSFPDINLVIAHQLEAEKLINLFSMERVESERYKLYRNSVGMKAIVSGMGFNNAKAATDYLAEIEERGDRVRAWLNIGIAGHQSAVIGCCFTINKITYKTSGVSSFPIQIFSDVPSIGLASVDNPELNYPGDVVYDMEAAGFWEGASKCVSIEFVQCLKIISDNKDHSIGKVTDELVLSLVEKNLQLIVKCCGQLQELVKDYNEILKLDSAFQVLLNKLHFTVTQQNQLKRLCQRYRALGRDSELEKIADLDFSSSNEALGLLSKGITI